MSAELAFLGIATRDGLVTDFAELERRTERLENAETERAERLTPEA